MCINLSISNFLKVYIIDPTSKDLSSADQKIATFASIILVVFLGLFHFAALLNRSITKSGKDASAVKIESVAIKAFQESQAFESTHPSHPEDTESKKSPDPLPNLPKGKIPIQAPSEAIVKLPPSDCVDRKTQVLEVEFNAQPLDSSVTDVPLVEDSDPLALSFVMVNKGEEGVTIDQIKSTFARLVKVCAGDRVDVDENGLVSEVPYPNSWGAAIWRMRIGSNHHDLSNLKPLFGKAFMEYQTGRDEELYALIIEAIEGLCVLKQGYSGEKMRVCADVVGFAYKLLEEPIIEELKFFPAGVPAVSMKRVFSKALVLAHLNPFKDYQDGALARWLSNAFYYLKSADPEQQYVIKRASFGFEGLKEIWRIDKEWQGKYQSSLDVLQDLESSVANPSKSAGSYAALNFIYRKALLFASLSPEIEAEELIVWNHFLEQLRMAAENYHQIMVESQVRGGVGLEKLCREQANRYLDCLDSLGGDAVKQGVLIHMGYNSDRGGHAAPTSLFRGSDNRYYLVAHNAGAASAGASQWDVVKQCEFGHTAVPYGTLTREEAGNFVKSALSFWGRNGVLNEVEIAFKALFPIDKKLSSDFIPERPFQRIDNCCVRNINEWIIFSLQRLGLHDQATKYLNFNLAKRHDLHQKYPVEPLKRVEFW